MNVIHSTLLCWIPAKQEYLTLAGVDNIGGKVIEKHLSDTEAESKAFKLNNQTTSGYYLAVYY